MEYGVQVDNKFVFGSDDEIGDPSDLIRLGAVEKKTPAQKKAERDEAKRAKAKAEAERVKAAAAAAAAKTEKANAAAAAAAPTRGSQRGRGGRGRGDGPRPPRFDRENADGAPKRDENFGGVGGEFRGRGRGRGRGGDRPFRGRGGFHAPAVDGVHAPDSEEHKDFGDENTPPSYDGERRGRGRGGFGRGGRGGFRGRQFDRQSGSDRTGIRPTEKKEGYGKGNWGTEQDELVGETEEVKLEDAEPVAPREKTAEELEAERIEAEIAKQKTLAEYRASLQKEESKFNTRKAGEGVEDNFGKLVPLQRKEVSDNDAHEVVVLGKEKKKQVVDVDIHFVSSREPRGGGERGGRGGFRGGRGRGGNHYGRGGNASGGGSRPRHDQSHFKRDESDFPALG